MHSSFAYERAWPFRRKAAFIYALNRLTLPSSRGSLTPKQSTTVLRHACELFNAGFGPPACTTRIRRSVQVLSFTSHGIAHANSPDNAAHAPDVVAWNEPQLHGVANAAIVDGTNLLLVALGDSGFGVSHVDTFATWLRFLIDVTSCQQLYVVFDNKRGSRSHPHVPDIRRTFSPNYLESRHAKLKRKQQLQQQGLHGGGRRDRVIGQGSQKAAAHSTTGAVPARPQQLRNTIQLRRSCEGLMDQPPPHLADFVHVVRQVGGLALYGLPGHEADDLIASLVAGLLSLAPAEDSEEWRQAMAGAATAISAGASSSSVSSSSSTSSSPPSVSSARLTGLLQRVVVVSTDSDMLQLLAHPGCCWIEIRQLSNASSSQESSPLAVRVRPALPGLPNSLIRLHEAAVSTAGAHALVETSCCGSRGSMGEEKNIEGSAAAQTNCAGNTVAQQLQQQHTTTTTTLLPPVAYPDFLALVGKAEAGVPGVGLGSRASINLLARFGSISGIVRAYEEGILDGTLRAVSSIAAGARPGLALGMGSTDGRSSGRSGRGSDEASYPPAVRQALRNIQVTRMRMDPASVPWERVRAYQAKCRLGQQQQQQQQGDRAGQQQQRGPKQPGGERQDGQQWQQHQGGQQDPKLDSFQQEQQRQAPSQCMELTQGMVRPKHNFGASAAAGSNAASASCGYGGPFNAGRTGPPKAGPGPRFGSLLGLPGPEVLHPQDQLHDHSVAPFITALAAGLHRHGLMCRTAVRDEHYSMYDIVVYRHLAVTDTAGTPQCPSPEDGHLVAGFAASSPFEHATGGLAVSAGAVAATAAPAVAGAAAAVSAAVEATAATLVAMVAAGKHPPLVPLAVGCDSVGSPSTMGEPSGDESGEVLYVCVLSPWDFKYEPRSRSPPGGSSQEPSPTKEGPHNLTQRMQQRQQQKQHREQQQGEPLAGACMETMPVSAVSRKMGNSGVDPRLLEFARRLRATVGSRASLMHTPKALQAALRSSTGWRLKRLQRLAAASGRLVAVVSFYELLEQGV